MLQSERVIYSCGSDKIIADKNGLSLYVAAEDKSYPLRARKSYWETGDYIYIEFINHAVGRFRIRDYSDAALESWRKLNRLNLDELTPWIADECSTPTGQTNLSATHSCSTKSSSAKNEKFTPFDLFRLLFCLGMQGAFIGAYVGAEIGFLFAPAAFLFAGTRPPVSDRIKSALANWIVCVGSGAAIGSAPVTLPAFTAYKFFEYAAEKMQHDSDNSKKNRF